MDIRPEGRHITVIHDVPKLQCNLELYSDPFLANGLVYMKCFQKGMCSMYLCPSIFSCINDLKGPI